MSESRDQSFRGAVRRWPDFCRGERFMIGALRRWLRGGEDWQRAIRDAGRHLKPALAMSFTNALNSLGEGLGGGGHGAYISGVNSFLLVVTALNVVCRWRDR